MLMGLTLATTLLAYLVGERWLAPPIAELPPHAMAAMTKLHALSVGGLLAYIGFRLRTTEPGLRQ
jgi:hypothetical protein